MMRFLRKRNQKHGIGQTRLIPWKSGGQEYDLLIPMSATITSFITSIAGLVVFILLLNGFSNEQYGVVKWLSFVINIICSIQTAVMIGLTIRAAKHKKQAPVIPKGPLYHETIDNKVGVVEEDIEMQEVDIDENHVESDGDSSSSHSCHISGPNIIHVNPIIHAECHI